MKRSVLFLAVCFAITTINAQTITARSGVGIGSLKLGMSEKEVVSLLKGDITWVSYAEHKFSYQLYGGVDSVIQFIMGFDSVGQYRDGLPEKLPVFALYFKDQQLNFITVTSYGTDTDLADRVVFDKGIKFKAKTKTCIEALGNEYFTVEYSDYSGVYYYYKLGLELDFEDDRLVAVGIYPPAPNLKGMIR